MNKKKLTLLRLMAVLLLIVSALLGQSASANPHGVAPTRLLDRKPLPAFVGTQLVGGFWRVDHSFESVLLLSNRLDTDPIAVQPTLVLSDGTRFPLMPLTLQPSGSATVNINEAFNHLPMEIRTSHERFGVIDIAYSWAWQSAVSAEVQNIDPDRSLSSTSALHLGPSQEVLPVVMHGLWWKRTPATQASIRLTNASAVSIPVTIDVSDSKNRLLERKTISLSPGHTVMHNVNLAASPEGSVGGIEVYYAGPERGLVVDGDLEDAGRGFSASLQLRPSLGHPADVSRLITLASTGLMVGKPGTGQMFPEQVAFHPWMNIRNVSSYSKDLVLAAHFMYGEVPKTIQLTHLQLAPMQSSYIDVNSIVEALRLPPQVMEIDTELTYAGLSGDLIVSSGSIDEAASYVFEVPATLVSGSTSKHICFWKAIEGTDTMISIWNHKLEGQDLILTLHFDGGQYDYPIHLNASSSQTLSIYDIVRRGSPDAAGHSVPTTIESGAATIKGASGETEDINVTMTTASYDVNHATCIVHCIQCNGYTSLNATYSSSNPANGATQFRAIGQYSGGGQYDFTSSSTWSSSNNSIATVGNGAAAGLVTPVSDGTATITVTSPPLLQPVPTCGAPPNCGDNDSVPLIDTIGVGLHRATYEAEPAGSGCQFTLTCPAGTQAVCGTPSYSSPTACQGVWNNLLFFSYILRRNSALQCFGLSPNSWSSHQGTCD